jgi:hypothetical protein
MDHIWQSIERNHLYSPACVHSICPFHTLSYQLFFLSFLFFLFCFFFTFIYTEYARKGENCFFFPNALTIPCLRARVTVVVKSQRYVQLLNAFLQHFKIQTFASSDLAKRFSYTALLPKRRKMKPCNPSPSPPWEKEPLSGENSPLPCRAVCVDFVFA